MDWRGFQFIEKNRLEPFVGVELTYSNDMDMITFEPLATVPDEYLVVEVSLGRDIRCWDARALVKWVHTQQTTGLTPSNPLTSEPLTIETLWLLETVASGRSTGHTWSEIAVEMALGILLHGGISILCSATLEAVLGGGHASPTATAVLGLAMFTWNRSRLLDELLLCRPEEQQECREAYRQALEKPLPLLHGCVGCGCVDQCAFRRG